MQVSAHGAAAMLGQMQQHAVVQDSKEHWGELAAVFQLLLLLVQQLQGVPAQEWAAFLHSPPGSEALRVLSEVSRMEAAGWGVALTMILPTVPQEPEAAVQPWQLLHHTMACQPEVGCSRGGRLLLQVAMVEQPGVAGGAAGSSSACAGSSSSSGCLAASRSNHVSGSGTMYQASSNSSSISSAAGGSAATCHAVASRLCAWSVVTNFGSGG